MKKAVGCVAVAILICGFALGQAQEKVLWTFTGASSDGWGMKSNLVFDSSGNLYGTTFWGGSSSSCGSEGPVGCGIVFELSPQSDGTWTETVLYNFCGGNNNCPDGAEPAAGLIFDKSGNLYGTTNGGGSNGGGTAFELSAPTAPGGVWTHSVLYNFCSTKAGNQCLDGFGPGNLVFDKSGNLYGTTGGGGSGHLGNPYYGGGTVFELSPGSSGWTERVLYNFCSLGEGNDCPDGAFPTGVRFDKSGNLYGATLEGGTTRNFGTVFELLPVAGGWAETVLYTFTNASGGGLPRGTITLGPAGSLYGTLTSGGVGNSGGVFRLNSTTGYRVVSPLGTGGGPMAGVLVDSTRELLYGTTFDGGVNSPYGGTVFQIGETGQATTIYSFCQQTHCADGENPNSALVEDKAGNLYGTTFSGGSPNGIDCDDGGCGVVFEITP